MANMKHVEFESFVSSFSKFRYQNLEFFSTLHTTFILYIRTSRKSNTFIILSPKNGKVLSILIPQKTHPIER